MTGKPSFIWSFVSEQEFIGVSRRKVFLFYYCVSNFMYTNLINIRKKNDWHCKVRFCAALCFAVFTVLYFTILYCSVLRCNAIQCNVMQIYWKLLAVLYKTVPHCFHCHALGCNASPALFYALCCTSLYCTILLYVALWCTVRSLKLSSFTFRSNTNSYTMLWKNIWTHLMTTLISSKSQSLIGLKIR